MRVLFLSPNRLDLVVPPLPLGLASVIASLGPEHPVAVLDFMFAPDPLGELFHLVRDFRPDVIGISVRNIDNQDSRHPVSYVAELKELVTLLRTLTPTPILLGGAGFSVMPREFMAYVEADFGLIGEGETALPAFLAACETGNWAQVPGLVWRQEGEWRANPPHLVPDLNRLPAPALKYFSPRRYQEAQGSAKLPGMIPVQSRRGCPMGCIYCTTPELEGRRLRARAPEQVAAWLAAWHEEWGLTHFYFVDNIFNHPPDYARSLCGAIADLRLPLEWSGLINPAFPDQELFHLMRRAGAIMVQAGNESGSGLILRNLGKGFGLEQVRRTLSMLQAEDLPYTCFLLLGGPGETQATVQESVSLMEEYQPRMVNLTVGIRIHPGLPLHKIALAEGVVRPGESLLWPKFYLAPAVRDWIWDFLDGVRTRHPNWIF
jgi:radical SAM superfamily enzyme YgiQ (UPF0313 family)